LKKNSKSPKEKEEKKNQRKENNKLIWHWGLDFKDALVIVVM